jgi:hypothetical protein
MIAAAMAIVSAIFRYDIPHSQSAFGRTFAQTS